MALYKGNQKICPIISHIGEASVENYCYERGIPAFGYSEKTITLPTAVEKTYDDFVYVEALGKSEVNGVPTPTAPVIPKLSYGATITAESKDKTKQTTVEIPALYSVLNSSGNYIARDELKYLGSGGWYYKQEVAEIELKSSNSWAIYNYSGTVGVHSGGNILSQSAMRGLGMSTHESIFTTQTSKEHFMWLGVNNAYIYWCGILDALGLTTADQFKNWLDSQKEAGNTVKVWQILPKPVEKVLFLGDLKTQPKYTNIKVVSDYAPEIISKVKTRNL